MFQFNANGQRRMFSAGIQPGSQEASAAERAILAARQFAAGQPGQVVARVPGATPGSIGPLVQGQNGPGQVAAFGQAVPAIPGQPVIINIPGYGPCQVIPQNQAAFSGQGQGQALPGIGQGMAGFATVGPYDQTMGNRSPVLEDWAKLLSNKELVAEWVAPVVRVNGDVVDVVFFKDNTAFQVRKMTGSRNSTPRMRQFEHSLERTTLDEVFIERTFIPSGSNRGPLAMGQAATNGLVNDINLTQEYFTAKTVFDPANYVAARKATPATKWGNVAATPFDDVYNQVPKVVGNDGVFILFGEDAWQKFSVHQNTIDKVHGSIGGIVSPEQVANKLGVKEIKIGKAKYLDNNVMTNIWDDHVLIFARKPDLGQYITGYDASAFYIYRQDTPEVMVFEWPTMDFGIGGNYYQAAIIQKFVTTGSDYLKFLLYDVVA
jgi:hypothetical protein